MASSSQLPRIYGDRSNDLLESDFSKTSFKVQDFVAALSEKLVVNSTEDTGREPLACSDCQAIVADDSDIQPSTQSHSSEPLREPLTG